jgi:hypothetical protein
VWVIGHDGEVEPFDAHLARAAVGGDSGQAAAPSKG